MIGGIIWKYASGGLAFLCLMLGLKLALETRHAHKVEAQLEREHVAHLQTIADYRAAAQQAEAQQQANIAHVTTQQQKITSEVSHDYQTQLADLRARFERLRKSPGSNSSVSQGSAVPANGATADGADDPTGERLSPSERQLAAEISLRLNALQEWVRKQAAVDPNERPAPR